MFIAVTARWANEINEVKNVKLLYFHFNVSCTLFLVKKFHSFIITYNFFHYKLYH